MFAGNRCCSRDTVPAGARARAGEAQLPQVGTKPVLGRPAAAPWGGAVMGTEAGTSAARLGPCCPSVYPTRVACLRPGLGPELPCQCWTNAPTQWPLRKAVPCGQRLGGPSARPQGRWVREPVTGRTEGAVATEELGRGVTFDLL